MSEQLWAMTTYYNPCRYARRLQNFKNFRQRLGVPLIAVELAYGHEFELGREDADILLQLKGTTVLWQKERLLNLGLSVVPPSASAIAWLDCDIVFEDQNWSSEATKLLQTYPLIQLFTSLVDLDRHESVGAAFQREEGPSGLSVAHIFASGLITPSDLRPPSGKGVRRCLCGLAWAAQRELLQKHGFYDAMILGSGDRALSFAAFGRFEDFISTAHLNQRRSAHYMRWAAPFFEAIRSRVTALPGRLVHLWHGDIADRQYIERHIQLANFDFDPSVDLTLDEQGVWTWATTKAELQQFVSGYFAARREDGISESPLCSGNMRL